MIRLPSMLIPALFMLLTACSVSDPEHTPEPQVSFTKVNKGHEYYVKQAELWYMILENDQAYEEAWYNYYRACRNALGTADWKEDIVKESPYLRLGEDIVKLMEEYIPNTFTYYFVKGSTGGVDPGAGAYLMKAWEMRKDFQPLLSAVTTYAESTHDPELRKEALKKWYELDEMNPGLLLYARNVLASTDSNAILLTQHDNDTYPVWMLQDVKGHRADVETINIDFLLLESFRKPVFKQLDIPPFKLDAPDINEYRTNWENVVHHFLKHYPMERPLHIALTVDEDWYEGYLDSMKVSGLTYAFRRPDLNEVQRNINLYENEFILDSLNFEFEHYFSGQHVRNMNLNYTKPLEIIKEYYQSTEDMSKMEAIDSLLQKLTIIN